MTRNIAAVLLDDHLHAGRGGNTAVLCGGGRWTYRDLHADACRWANALARMGIGKGDRVLILLQDGPEWIAAFLGTARLGAVPVPLNTWLPGSEYRYYFEDSGARVLIAQGEILDRAGAAGALPPSLEAVAAVGDWDHRRFVPAARAHSFRELLDAERPESDAVEPDDGDAAFWLYSSGTTGRPKGVIHRHASIIFSADHYARRVLDIRPDDIVFSAAKLFFAYGLGNAFHFPFRFGAVAALYPGKAAPEAILEAIRVHRPTLFFSVPTLYAAMLQWEGAAAGDLSSVRLCVSAGEALPAEIYRQWMERFGVPILDGIGTTEMAHIFISNAPGSIRPGSTGTVVSGYRARILDESGAEMPDGEIGNLWVSGGSAFSEYWGRPDASREARSGEWVRTGDKFRRDADGYFWFAGRSDDMLKVSGQWVSPFEVEGVLLGHPAVLECAVVGRIDGHGLLKPQAFIVLRAGHGPSAALEEELAARVRSSLAPFKAPRWIEFVAELPKTATGKVQRYRLRASGNGGGGAGGSGNQPG